MTSFKFTWQKVLDGSKTQTARLVNPGDQWGKYLSTVTVGRDAGKFNELAPMATDATGVEGIVSVYRRNGSLRWRVGNTYAVQQDYGKPTIHARQLMGVGAGYEYNAGKPDGNGGKDWFPVRYRVLKITQQDVRQYTEEDIQREGFASRWDFYQTWTKMHDHTMYPMLPPTPEMLATFQTVFYMALPKRPLNRYLAWVLNYELTKGE